MAPSVQHAADGTPSHTRLNGPPAAHNQAWIMSSHETSELEEGFLGVGGGERVIRSTHNKQGKQSLKLHVLGCVCPPDARRRSCWPLRVMLMLYSSRKHTQTH